MDGYYTITELARDWLFKSQKALFLDVNSKGCGGNSITWLLTDYRGNRITFSERLHSFMKEGLRFEVDYINEPLLEGLHVNILNKDKCGCGKSFS